MAKATFTEPIGARHGIARVPQDVLRDQLSLSHGDTVSVSVEPESRDPVEFTTEVFVDGTYAKVSFKVPEEKRSRVASFGKVVHTITVES